MNRKILVLGAGTAGCAAAIFLRQHSFEVVLIDRAIPHKKSTTPKIGESLSPDAAPLLQQLGIWEDFSNGPHLKCYGNVSYWNSPEPQHHDFMQHPVGHGWHLDRSMFDDQLLQHAQDSGAIFHDQTSIDTMTFKDGQWSIVLTSQDTDSTELNMDFVVDATGRNSWLARQQGVSRLYESEQLALVTFLDIHDDFDDSRTMVETVEHGWWYSASIPGNRMATAFFCQPSREQRRQWLFRDNWQELLKQAPQTAARIKTAQGKLMDEPRFTDAHSSILESLQRPGWVAVGDAALTYDPMAAHGITMALTSARDAADAIAHSYQGDAEAMERYESVLWAAFQRYAEERHRISLF